MNNLLTVSQLNFYLRSRMEEENLLHPVLVKGEVTFCRCSTAGHLYFTLAQGGSSISCTILARSAARMRKLPSEGEACVVQADVEISPMNSAVRLLVSDYMPSGAGRQAADRSAYLEKLKQKGYLDAERKKPLPFLPLRVGLLTAPDSAAYADFISVLKQQPAAPAVVFYPALVQGESAPFAIAAGLRALDASGCDLLVCIRGGGSKEDLAAFDDPQVIETAAHLTAPLISGVGHEIDVSILDLVADLRVPTPTAAAKAIAELFETAACRAEDARDLLIEAAERQLTARKQKVSMLRQMLPILSPARRAADLKEKLDFCRRRMERAAGYAVGQEQTRREGTALRLKNAFCQRQMQLERELEKISASLKALSPYETLRRGYAIPVRQESGPLRKGENLRLIFADAEAEAVVTDVNRKGDCCSEK